VTFSRFGLPSPTPERQPPHTPRNNLAKNNAVYIENFKTDHQSRGWDGRVSVFPILIRSYDKANIEKWLWRQVKVTLAQFLVRKRAWVRIPLPSSFCALDFILIIFTIFCDFFRLCEGIRKFGGVGEMSRALRRAVAGLPGPTCLITCSLHLLSS
jgi:hypothetical protein